MSTTHCAVLRNATLSTLVMICLMTTVYAEAPFPFDAPIGREEAILAFASGDTALVSKAINQQRKNIKEAVYYPKEFVYSLYLCNRFDIILDTLKSGWNWRGVREHFNIMSELQSTPTPVLLRIVDPRDSTSAQGTKQDLTKSKSIDSSNRSLPDNPVRYTFHAGYVDEAIKYHFTRMELELLHDIDNSNHSPLEKDLLRVCLERTVRDLVLSGGDQSRYTILDFALDLNKDAELAIFHRARQWYTDCSDTSYDRFKSCGFFDFSATVDEAEAYYTPTALSTGIFGGEQDHDFFWPKRRLEVRIGGGIPRLLNTSNKIFDQSWCLTQQLGLVFQRQLIQASISLAHFQPNSTLFMGASQVLPDWELQQKIYCFVYGYDLINSFVRFFPLVGISQSTIDANVAGEKEPRVSTPTQMMFELGARLDIPLYHRPKPASNDDLSSFLLSFEGHFVENAFFPRTDTSQYNAWSFMWSIHLGFTFD